MTRNKDLLGEVQHKVKSIMPIHDTSQETRLLEELVGKVQIDMEYIEKELAKIEIKIEGLRKEVFTLSFDQSNSEVADVGLD